MNKYTLSLFGCMASVCLWCGCGQDTSTEKAALLYQKAEQCLNQKAYPQARAALDSLNARYPMAIELREKGIILKSQISLKEAQDSLQHTDSLLQTLRQGQGKPSEIAATQQKFDMLCLKVRFYHKKIEKLNALKTRMDDGE